MNATFVYNGMIPRTTPTVDIANTIRKKIAEQQSQFNSGMNDKDPDNIELVEYCYTDAEPNCKFVYAKWKIKD